MTDATGPIKALSDSGTGQYEIVTHSGARYLLNLNARTFRRLQQGMAGDLRRDGDSVHLLALEQCRVGARMELLIDLEVPGVDYTRRSSTMVMQITARPDAVSSDAKQSDVDRSDRAFSDAARLKRARSDAVLDDAVSEVMRLEMAVSGTGTAHPAIQWSDVLSAIDALGGNSAEVHRRATLDGVSADFVADAIERYLGYVAAHRDSDESPFEDWDAMSPGHYDARVIAQDIWWVDVLRRPHKVSTMSLEYLQNVTALLRQFPAAYFFDYHDYPATTETEADVWMETSPLLIALGQAIAKYGDDTP